MSRASCALASMPAAATASAADSATSATRSSSPSFVTRSYQSGFSSSMPLTYIRIASSLPSEPSEFHEFHLARSSAFQKGFGVSHGPAVTWLGEGLGCGVSDGWAVVG